MAERPGVPAATAPDAPTDEELMLRYRDGEVSAFQRLLDRHRRPLFRFLVRQVGNRQIADDLFQDICMKVIKARERYEPSARFTTWLYGIARNRCIDHFRTDKTARHRPLADGPVEADHPGPVPLPDPTPGPDRRAEAGRLRERLGRALAALNPDQREVFLLKEETGMTFEELAETLDAPVNTVKSRMRYALTALRKELADWRADR